jgi:hypothetical protein
MTSVPEQFDAKPWLDRYFNGLADGSISDADPFDIHDMVDQLSVHPDAVAGSLGLGVNAMVPQDVQDVLLDRYFTEAVSRDTDVVDVFGQQVVESYGSRVGKISRTVGTDPESVEAADYAAREEGDYLAFDSMLASYYNS